MGKMGSFWPAAGEKILGFGPLRVLSHTPRGVGGWVPGFSGVRLYSQNLNGLSPMVLPALMEWYYAKVRKKKLCMAPIIQ